MRVHVCFRFALVVRVHVHACVHVHVRVHVCFCFTLSPRGPLLPAAAWLGRLSAAPPLLLQRCFFLGRLTKKLLRLLEHTFGRNYCC